MGAGGRRLRLDLTRSNLRMQMSRFYEHKGKCNSWLRTKERERERERETFRVGSKGYANSFMIYEFGGKGATV